ncbi:MAG: chromate transporter [Trueperaceae bacterium]|nr:chromate transporter [Trueperaceae bacterium]
MLADLWQIFYSFGKVGIFGFGGGPSFVPLIQEEVVEVQKWLSKEEFLDAFAFGNALPGPIATKLAGFVGYKVAGWPGAVMGLLGVTVPTIIAMVIFFNIYLRYQNNPAFNNFLKGVRPVVIALLALVVWEFIPKALGNPPQWLGNWALWLVAIVAFVASVRFNVHPALLIVLGGVVGLTLLR